MSLLWCAPTLALKKWGAAHETEHVHKSLWGMLHMSLLGCTPTLALKKLGAACGSEHVRKSL